jgi:hypothetical protein
MENDPTTDIERRLRDVTAELATVKYAVHDLLDALTTEAFSDRLYALAVLVEYINPKYQQPPRD